MIVHPKLPNHFVIEAEEEMTINSECHSIDELLALPRTFSILVFIHLPKDLFGVPVTSRTSHTLGHGFFLSSSINKEQQNQIKSQLSLATLRH